LTFTDFKIKNMNKIKHLLTLALAAFAALGSAHAQIDCTEPTCPTQITVVHVAGSISPATVNINYQTVQYDSKCWITTNLGATAKPASVTDDTDAAAGWYFQFNRKQGYSITGGTTTDGSGTRAPITEWITPIDETADWQTENDPCRLLLGPSWRIPTSTEWTDADALEAWANYDDTYASPLKLHAAGYLGSTAGALGNRGAAGLYWSSTQSSTTAGYRLGFSSSYADVNYYNKAYGFSLRCCRNL
jgi:uncharacterized protein (TIGR02145 family)